MEKEDTLTIVAAEGFVSMHALSIVEPGVVLKSVTAAATPVYGVFRGAVLFSGQICLHESRLLIRVEQLLPPKNIPQYPGVVTTLNNVVRFQLVVDEIVASAEELKRLAVGSFVGLERKAGSREYVSLVCMGRTIAHGTLVITGGDYGVRITRVEERPGGEYAPQSTGAWVDPATTGSRIEEVNLAQPRLFTTKQEKELTGIAGETLALLKHTSVEAPGLSVVPAQTTYAQAMELPVTDGGYIFVVLKELARPGVRPVPAVAASESAVAFVQERESRFTPPAGLVSWTEKMLSADKPPEYHAYTVIVISNGFRKKNPGLFDEPFDKLTTAYNNSWAKRSETNYGLYDSETIASAVQIVPANDMVVAVDFTEAPEDAPALRWIFPYICVKPYL